MGCSELRSGRGRRMRDRLEAVVFDAGGTLVRLDFEWMADALAELGVAVTSDAIRRGEVEGRRRYDVSRRPPLQPGEPPPALGTAHDTRAYFAGMLEDAGVPEPVVAEALLRFRARHEAVGLWTRPMEGARHALDALAALRLRAAVVSNSDGRAEQHLIDCGVRDGLEFVVDSYLVGVEKPDPRIFAIALERMGVRPERAIYVGDIRSVDERGAEAAGMHFVLIDPHGGYAGPRTPAIREIGELPDHIAARFATRAAEPAAGRTPARDGDTTGGER